MHDIPILGFVFTGYQLLLCILKDWHKLVLRVLLGPQQWLSYRLCPQTKFILHVYISVQGCAFLSQCMSSTSVGFLDMDTDVFHPALGMWLALILLLPWVELM